MSEIVPLKSYSMWFTSDPHIELYLNVGQCHLTMSSVCSSMLEISDFSLGE